MKDALLIVSEIYIDIILEICEKNPTPYMMVGNESFCIWRDYNDYFITWEDSADKIKRTIDA